MKRRKTIYLDNASATPLEPRVIKAMARFWNKDFGNPASIHTFGVRAKRALTEARDSVAKELGARAKEVLFVSGGTEANNLAILGFTRAVEEKGLLLYDLHFMALAIEHPSVLECMRALEKRGASVSYIPVTREGIIDIPAFAKELKNNTVFVSVQLVNSEIGTLEPLKEIAKILRRHRKENVLPEELKKLGMPFPLFHTDASQGPLFYDVNVQKLGVDYLTLDGQKIYGPKGVGVLYAREGVPIVPLLHGGGQEHGLRPGTENVPGIVGFAKALYVADKERTKTSRNLAKLRDYFIQRLCVTIPKAELNGHVSKRSPNNVNISIPGIDNEWVVIALDARGIAIGTRSACLSEEKRDGSYVVKALGKSDAFARSSLRFTLGKGTTKMELDYVISMLSAILKTSNA